MMFISTILLLSYISNSISFHLNQSGNKIIGHRCLRGEIKDSLATQSSSALFSRPRVAVVGGGFGGLYFSLSLVELSKSRGVDITLIDSSDRFTFAPLLYELAVGDADIDEVCPRFETILGDDKAYDCIKFVQGSATGVDFTSKSVEVASGML